MNFCVGRGLVSSNMILNFRYFICGVLSPPSPSLTVEEAPQASAPKKPVVDEDEDEDFDLFGDDNDEEAAALEKLKQDRVAEYAAKKAASEWDPCVWSSPSFPCPLLY